MHRFLIGRGHEPGGLCRLDDAEARHALRVLRLRPGARVQLSDGCGRLYLAELTRADEGGVEARLLQDYPDGEPPFALTLYQGLPKFEKLELIAQKATELGAMRVVPVRMERSVVKLSEVDGAKRRDRLQKICAEAAKQCGRARVPEVLEPMSFARALEHMRARQLMLMAWEQARGFSLADARAEYPDVRDIGLLIGPEGGISRVEADQAGHAGARAFTLGPRILRTETAAIAAGALCMHLWGDL